MANFRLCSMCAVVVVLVAGSGGSAAEPFKGWVRICGPDASVPGGTYFTTTDHTNGSRYDTGVVRFTEKRDGTLRVYEPSSKTIFVGNLSPAERRQTYADTLERVPLDINIDDLLRRFRRDWPELKVRQKTEGDADVYDVEFAPTSRQVYVADHETSLIRQARYEQDGKEQTNFYHYDDPVVRDIYDIGVPRDARVVDNRPNGELKAVLDRVDARIERGLGADGVTVVAEALLADDGKAEPLGRLHMYAQRGRRLAYYVYTVGSWRVPERTGEGSGAPPIDTPTGWPEAPPPAEIMPRLATSIPEEAFTFDGVTNKTKRISLTAIDTTGTSLAPRDEDEHWMESESWHFFSFPGRFVFGSLRLEFYLPRTAGRVIRDNARPGQIGLALNGTFGGSNWPTETTLWIDPARDDVPVDYAFRRLDANGKHATREQRIRLSRHQQLAGRWFPVAWEDEQVVATLGEPSRVRRVFNAAIDTKLRLDDKWFADPKRQFRATTRPALAPLRPPATRRSTSGPVTAPTTSEARAAGASVPGG